MKLSISNIAWDSEHNDEMYSFLNSSGFSGLEIAPTKLFPDKPYDKNAEAVLWAKILHNQYGLVIPSMQSIWYGIHERIFGSPEERSFLTDYTKKAIDFASAVGCGNLVFGCPANRFITQNDNVETAINFFRELGDYAFLKGTIVGLEANPEIYHTNFINDTASALELIERVNSYGFKLNLDIGTMVYNDEDPSELIGKVKYINHVHISEPNLVPIKERLLHEEVRNILMDEGYDKFVSIEMSTQKDIELIKGKMNYIRRLFK